MTRIVLFAVAIVAVVGKLAFADEPDIDELLRAGDAFIEKLPENFKAGNRREYFEVRTNGKLLGVIQGTTRKEREGDKGSYSFEYSAVIKYTDGNRVISEGKGSMDMYFFPQRMELHQQLKRTDGASAERAIEISVKKKKIIIRREQGGEESEDTLAIPKGRLIMMDDELIEAIATSRIRSLAVREFDPETEKIQVKVVSVQSLPDGKTRVDVTPTGETTPSYSFSLSKKGRVTRCNKGGEEEVRLRIKKTRYEELLKKFDDKDEADEEAE